jgi:hypothetical protein
MAYTPTDEQVQAARTAQEAEDKLLRAMRYHKEGKRLASLRTYHDDYIDYQHKMSLLFDACEFAPEQVRAARLAVLNSGESRDADNARYYPPIARSMAFSTDVADGTSRPSQNINSYGYDGEHRYLDVVYQSSNTIYRYLDVTNEEYEALEAAASKGSHISRHIKSHSFIKVER